MTSLIERKAYQITIESDGAPQRFLAVQNIGRDEFVAYLFNQETGDYEYAFAPDSKEKIVDEAIDYMVEQWNSRREDLSVVGGENDEN